MDESPDPCLPWKVAGEASPLLGISSEPSPEASGPPGGFLSFRTQNEHQDHLPGHPRGQEHTLRHPVQGNRVERPRKGVCAGPLRGKWREVRAPSSSAAACLPTPPLQLCVWKWGCLVKEGPLIENLPSQPVLSGAREESLLEAVAPPPRPSLSPRTWSFPVKGLRHHPGQRRGQTHPASAQAAWLARCFVRSLPHLRKATLQIKVKKNPTILATAASAPWSKAWLLDMAPVADPSCPGGAVQDGEGLHK